MKEEDESDWNDICRLTEGFTGADLNALMFAAQLAVVHSHLSKCFMRIVRWLESMPWISFMHEWSNYFNILYRVIECFHAINPRNYSFVENLHNNVTILLWIDNTSSTNE